MIPTQDPDYNPNLGAAQSIIYNLWHKTASQPAIGNPVITGAVVGINNALTPPIASVVTPLVGGANSIVKFAAIGLGAIVLIKILK
jgi:hypothetical protein